MNLFWFFGNDALINLLEKKYNFNLKYSKNIGILNLRIWKNLLIKKTNRLLPNTPVEFFDK